MQRRSGLAMTFIAGMGLCCTVGPLHAFVTTLTPLRERLAHTPFIVLAKVEKIFPDKPAMVLSIARHFKGKLPFTRLPINIAGDADGKKHNHTAELRKRLAEKTSVVLFIDSRLLDNKRSRYMVFGFTNGTWFQVIGLEVEDKRVSWAFTHCEPYLRRTFAGTTAEMRQIIIDGLSGKKKPPEPNKKEKPGLGPEIKAARGRGPRFSPLPPYSGGEGLGVRGVRIPRGTEYGGEGRSALRPPHPRPLSPEYGGEGSRAGRAGSLPNHSGPSSLCFGVIPTLGIGGPLAILALLFPGLFGGALLVLRSWAVLLTVAGINSTLLLFSVWFPRLLRGTWLETGLGLWYTMLVITMAGTVWAWRSHARHLAAGSAPAGEPTRSEHIILWVSSIVFLATFLLVRFLGELSALDPSWKLLVVFTIGFWAAALYLLGHNLMQRRQTAPRPALPAHTIVLWAMIFASTVFAASWPGQTVSASSAVSAARDEVVKVAWQIVFSKGGFVVSPPLVDGNRVYVAAAHKQGGADTFGVLYCLSADTGDEIWRFDNDGEMFQVFSAPTIADGQLYIGEGFHENKGCRMYCLNAVTGKKIWDFPTASHTESSPCVAGGKLYFGAGDDGVYCLNAKTGKQIWQYPGENGDTIPTILPRKASGPLSKKPLKLHVDASPLVRKGRLYLGSGVDRDAPGCAPAVFCLDAESGKKLWLMPLLNDNLPVWGSPVGAGGQIFFGLGNGDIMTDADEPAGALLCVDARTGREEWRFKTNNSILRKPAIDERAVYFGSRDGFCYGVDRKDGKLLWKQKAGSPIIASPTLFHCPHCATSRLYVLGSGGSVQCFSPATGFPLWDMDLGRSTFLASTPCVAGVSTSQGDRRRIYFGAGFGDGAKAALVCLEEK